MNSVTTGNVTETRTHNAQNQLTSMGNATLAFDNNGNTITDDQGHTLVYDAWNRLIAVKSGATLLKSYSYDGQGWRISEVPAGGTATDLYYSSQWQVLEERQAGNATAQNVWGITYVDQLVLRDRDADQDTSHTLEERLYALQDANQNVTAIITTSGTVAERYVLDPYGGVSVRNADWSVRGDGTVSASTFGWVYLHQGGRYDVVAGEYSFRHRDYSPTMMRWVQQDPMGYVDGNTLYAYVTEQPVSMDNPYGLAKRVYVFEGLSGFNADMAANIKNNEEINEFEVKFGNFSMSWALLYLVREIIAKDKNAIWQYYDERDVGSAVKDALAHAKTPIASATQPGTQPATTQDSQKP